MWALHVAAEFKISYGDADKAVAAVLRGGSREVFLQGLKVGLKRTPELPQDPLDFNVDDGLLSFCCLFFLVVVVVLFSLLFCHAVDGLSREP